MTWKNLGMKRKMDEHLALILRRTSPASRAISGKRKYNTLSQPSIDMAKEFACKDIGMDCGFKASASSELELMPKIVQHAKEAHKLDPIPAETVQKVKAAIKDKKGWF